jgi:hypothetical protein
VNVTHLLVINNRRFLSRGGYLQVRLASGGAILGYVFNDPNGPCVPFATLGPSFPHLSHTFNCFRTGLNIVSDFTPTYSDLLVSFTGSSLLALVLELSSVHGLAFSLRIGMISGS